MSVSIRGLKRARTRLHGCRSPNYGGGPGQEARSRPWKGRVTRGPPHKTSACVELRPWPHRCPRGLRSRGAQHI